MRTATNNNPELGHTFSYNNSILGSTFTMIMHIAYPIINAPSVLRYLHHVANRWHSMANKRKRFILYTQFIQELSSVKQSNIFNSLSCSKAIYIIDVLF